MFTAKLKPGFTTIVQITFKEYSVADIPAASLEHAEELIKVFNSGDWENSGHVVMDIEELKEPHTKH